MLTLCPMNLCYNPYVGCVHECQYCYAKGIEMIGGNWYRLAPCSGAATTGVVALKNHRKYIGIELNSEYIEISRKRIEQADVVRDDVW